MALTLASQILSKTKEVLNLLESKGKELDELQKAQIIQSLISARRSLDEALKAASPNEKKSPAYKQLINEYKEISESIEEQIKEINFADVQKALTYLEEGVSELINRKNAGEKVVEE